MKKAASFVNFEDGMPPESTMALIKDMFKLVGELMVTSFLYIGPSPIFLASVLHDIIAKGLSETDLPLDQGRI